jgi:2-C-methyl-D-erythritol 4-phosphate cytidylyltransferase
MTVSIPTANYWAVLPAAGSGSRFSSHQAKQYLSILGQTVMQHSVNRLCQLPLSACVIALAKDDKRAKTLQFEQPSLLHWVEGGAERMDSVLAALRYLKDKAQPDDWVLVHDVARPCIRKSQLNALLQQLAQHPSGGVLAIPVRDTLKLGENQQVVRTVSRDHLWQVQTPQMFRFSQLLQALETVSTQGIGVTDEASAMEFMGYPVQLVTGSADNIKITYPEDLALATAIMHSQQSDRV